MSRCWFDGCPSILHSAVKVDFLSLSYRQLEKQVRHWKMLPRVLVTRSWNRNLTQCAVIFFRPPGSWWCQRGDGAGLRDSGAGELQTDSDDGRDHLRALHVPENPQRLSGVPSSQVGDQFDSNDFSYIRQRESLWLSDLKCQRGDETLLTFPSALH